MSDTTATVRKEILEDAKAEIDARIDNLRYFRGLHLRALEVYEDPNIRAAVVRLDAEYDALLLEKDNLPVTLFSDRADEIEPTEAEAQALERRLAEIGENNG